MILLQMFSLLIISILSIICTLYVFSRFLGDEKEEDLAPINDVSDFQSKSQSGASDKGLLMIYLYEFYGRSFDFSGKTKRDDFWIVQITFIIIGLLLSIFCKTGNEAFGLNNDIVLQISQIYFFISIIPLLSLDIRRLRDTGKEPEWILLYLVPIVGVLILLFWYAKPSNHFSKRPTKVEILDSKKVNKNNRIHLENKLEELKSMLDTKIITEEEYKSMRRKILEDF